MHAPTAISGAIGVVDQGTETASVPGSKRDRPCPLTGKLASPLPLDRLLRQGLHCWKRALREETRSTARNAAAALVAGGGPAKSKRRGGRVSVGQHDRVCKCRSGQAGLRTLPVGGKARDPVTPR